MDLAVGVQLARSAGAHGERGAGEAGDSGIAAEGTGEELDGERQQVDGVERRDGGEVEQAVVAAGAGRDAGVVAVLVGVGDGEGEGGEGRGAAGVDDLAAERGEFTEGAETGREVAEKTAVRQEIETVRDLGLEAEAGGAEERVAGREAGVDAAGAAGGDDGERMRDRAVAAKMAGEAVAGTARDEAEGDGRADEGGGDFVHGAVAADGHDGVAILGDGGPGEFGGVAGAGRGGDGLAAAGGESFDGGADAGGAAGAGIEDVTDFQGRETFDHAGQGGQGWEDKTVPPRPRLHVLTGPTAVGKTEWALRWAERHGAEIVSCDSLLFYRGMDLGTAKPTAAELARVPHHLIDVRAAHEPMDIAAYVAAARAAVAGIAARGRPVLVTGGSGFYLAAFFGPVTDDIAVPETLRAEVRALPAAAALARLRELNPGGLGELDTANPRRVTRALERCLASGRTLPDLAAAFARQPGPFADCDAVLTRLERQPEELEPRIEARIRAMLAGGLVAEVRALRAAGFEANPSAARAIGYREVLAMLDGVLPERELAAAIARNTRALVKKQRTWFRTQLPAHRVLAAAAVTDEAELFPEAGGTAPWPGAA